MKTFFASLLLVAIGIVSTAVASTESPKVRVANTIEEVRKVIAAGEKNNTDAAVLDHQLKEIVLPVFDFVEMSKRSLGPNWSKASTEQKKDFVKVFSDLLARTYFKRIKASVTKSDIRVVDEQIDGARGVVKTVALVDGEEVKIDYRVQQKQNEWRVYDVIIENVGLISNYRNEFSSAVRKEGMDSLIVKLKEKRTEGEAADAEQVAAQ